MAGHELIEYFKVQWNAIALIEDGADVDDKPDVSEINGVVTFRAALRKGSGLRFTTATPPFTVFPLTRKIKVVAGKLDHNNTGYVTLEAATVNALPREWNWEVSFDLASPTGKVPYDPFFIPAVPNSVVDLTTVAPVGGSTGSQIIQGEQGYSIVDVQLVNGNTWQFYSNDPDHSLVSSVTLGTMPTIAEANAARDDAVAARDVTIGYRDTTLGYRNAAEGFMTTAGTSADTATTKAGEAEAARAASVAAKDTSVGAKDTAVAAANTATTKAGEATTMRNQAETFSTQTMGYRDTTIAAIDAASADFQDWMNTTQGYRNQAETFKIAAEQAVADANAMIIPDDSIDAPKLRTGAVTGTKLAADSVTSDKIAAKTIVAGDIADGTITAAQIQDGTISTSKLNNKSVTGGKIADDTIGSGQIAADAIGSSELADNAVDTAAIASKAVTGAKIADDTITALQVAPNAIGSSELADASVDTAAIINANVTVAKLNTAAKAGGFNYGIYSDTRKVGQGDGLAPMGYVFPIPFRITKITLDMSTADGSGNTVVMPKKNTTNFTSGAITIAAPAVTNSGVVTPNVDFAVGDKLLFDVTGIGTTPGKVLRAMIEGYAL